MPILEASDLNVSPPILHVAEGDVVKRGFDAGEEYTAVAVELVDLTAGTTEDDIDYTESGNIVTPTLEGFEEGHTYRMEVHFTNDDGVIWTRTLYIECVA